MGLLSHVIFLIEFVVRKRKPAHNMTAKGSRFAVLSDDKNDKQRAAAEKLPGNKKEKNGVKTTAVEKNAAQKLKVNQEKAEVHVILKYLLDLSSNHSFVCLGL